MMAFVAERPTVWAGQPAVQQKKNSWRGWIESQQLAEEQAQTCCAELASLRLLRTSGGGGLAHVVVAAGARCTRDHVHSKMGAGGGTART
jgi:hypothetical protein